MRNSTSVRDAFAYEASLRRVSDLGLRAALFRGACLIVVVVAIAVGDGPWYAYLPVLLAGFGCYLSATSNYYQGTQDEKVPKEPLARWSLDFTIRGLGQMSPDVPGITESLSYIPLAAVGPWLMHDSADGPRLLALAASLAWVASCVNAIFADPAFYNPYTPDHAWQARLALLGDAGRRTVLGPVCTGIGLALVLPASWSPDARLLAGALCVALGGVQLRLREVDRVLSTGSDAALNTVLSSRRTFGRDVHDLVGTPLDLLRSRVTQTPELEDKIGNDLADLEAGYATALALETEPDHGVDWPGALLSRLERFEGETRVHFDLKYPETLVEADRNIAHDVLSNLARNAFYAGARSGKLSLRYDNDLLEVRATDDGPAIDRRVWMRPGGGLNRVNERVRATGRGAGIVLVSDGSETPKLVVASWHHHLNRTRDQPSDLE